MPVTSVKLDSAASRHRRGNDGELQPIPTAVAPTPEPEPAEPEAADIPPAPRPEVTVALQDRHHAWLLDAAAREGRTPASYIEGLVRQACAADPHRIRNTLPQMPGQPAGTARR